MKDISILKDMLRIEKNMNTKKEEIIQNRDKELKALRGESLETTSEQLIKINEIELKNTEQDKRVQ
jgi:hypothetical protein